MQSKPNEAPRRAHRGKHRRAALAALPNPIEQDRLEAEASARAIGRLAEAAAAGAPLLDANGVRRSHVTLPEYRRGRAPANKGRRYPAEVLTTDEVLAILEQLPSAKSNTGLRNRALIVVMWRAGLRIAEALALEPRDVDLALGTLVVRRGKGAKRRTVAADAMTRQHLQAMLDRHRKLGLDSPELRAHLELGDDEEVPLFCTLAGPGRGRPMHSSVVREMLRLYARKAGIRKRVRPHGLRHTFAFQASQDGIPVPHIQQQLGHEDLAMTDHYVRHLAPADLIKSIGGRACPGEAPAAALATAAAFSFGQPAPITEPPSPSPRPKQQPRGAAYLSMQRRKRHEEIVLEALSDGDAHSTAALAEACGVPRVHALQVLHRLHDDDRIARVGMDPWHGGLLWKRAAQTVTRFTRANPRVYTPVGEPLPRMLDAIAALGGRASQAELGRLLELAPGTVQGYCRELEAQGSIERGGLDKSTSRRGSQVWRLPRPKKATYGAAGGYTLTIRVPR